jgi:hypothetical protein
LAARLLHATVVDDMAHLPRNYLYQSTALQRRAISCFGCAFAFVGPDFSSGVYVAMVGALVGTAVVAPTWIDQPRPRGQFERLMTRGRAQFF